MMFDARGVADLTMNTWTTYQLYFDWGGRLTWSIKTNWDFTLSIRETDTFGNTPSDHAAEHALLIS